MNSIIGLNFKEKFAKISICRSREQYAEPKKKCQTLVVGKCKRYPNQSLRYCI